MRNGFLAFQYDLLVNISDHEQLHGIFLREDAGSDDAEGIVDRIVGDRSYDQIIVLVSIVFVIAVVIDAGEPFLISLKPLDLEIFQIEFIGIDVCLFAFSVLCPAVAEFLIGRNIKTLAEVGIGSAARDVGSFDKVKAGVIDPYRFIHIFSIPPYVFLWDNMNVWN